MNYVDFARAGTMLHIKMQDKIQSVGIVYLIVVQSSDV